MDVLSINRSAFRSVKKQLSNCLPVLEDTDEMLFSKFKTALHCRHDFLHIIVAESIGTPALLGVTQPVFNILDVPEEYPFNLTPDIFVQGDPGLILDVTVSVSYETERSSKLIKYKPLADALEQMGTIYELKIIAVHPNLENLLNEFAAAGIYLSEDLHRLFLNSYQGAATICEDLKRLLPLHFLKNQEVTKVLRSEFKDQKDYIKNFSGEVFDLDWDFMDQQEVEQLFEDLVSDEQVREILRDKKHSPDDFSNAFFKLDEMEPIGYSRPKPTFHFGFAEDSPEIKPMKSLRIDQGYCMSILKYASKVNTKSKFLCLLSELYNSMKEILSHEHEKNLLLTGFFTGTYEGDKALKDNIKSRPGDKTSLRAHAGSLNLDVCLKKPNAERSHQLNVQLKETMSRECSIDSGVCFKKNHPEGRDYKIPSSCSPESVNSFDDFIKLLSRSSVSYKNDPILDLPIGHDASAAMEVKLMARKEFKDFYKMISSTGFLHMSYHTMIAADQAIHYSSLNTKSSSFCLINTGLPNVMHVFHGGSLPRSHDVGQPFFTVMITKNSKWLNPVFGISESHQIEIGGEKCFIIITHWRRLQIHKLALLRDQYYSCLSTGFDTFLRSSNSGLDKKSKIYHCYGFKSLVAQATGQKSAEFLMDVRYIVMSCYADYTNVSDLICEKFKPHYPNVFCRWIVAQLRKKSNIIQDSYRRKKFAQNTPVFLGKERLQNSLGGTMEFPSLWGDHTLYSLQDVFDELFVYTLTGKEPSSQYHESIKSIETILKFQGIFDGLSIEERKGSMSFTTAKLALLSKRPILYSRDVIRVSSQIYGQTVDRVKFQKKVNSRINTEPLSAIESTKACVPEYYSEDAIQKGFHTKKEDLSKLKAQLLKTGRSLISEYSYMPQHFKHVINGSPVNPESRTGRAKVHDLQLDMLMRFPGIQTVLDLANWNIFENNQRVIAHICIKAQYGAKREFYVVNHGAKAQVRVFENIFKSLAELCPNEMISVPGDRKMEYMSDSVNSVLREAWNEEDITMYTNGDCTKWSACETMGSFWAMCKGLGLLSNEQLGFCAVHLDSWGKKNIQIPEILLKGTKFITDKTQYFTNNGMIKSSQNFLQGMFNYSSSMKSVIATEFAIYMWEKTWGNTRPIKVKHLEHSDDYVLIVRVSDVEDFEDFRIYHKLSQRLHGIVDSEKKTNSQTFIMEFISLMCFNGQLSYPHIKKTKETGINVSGTGYQTDVMSASSRAGESVRLGIPQYSAYIQLLLQGINIYRKYSLQQKGRNAGPYSEDPYNLPIEMFGLPDFLPALAVGTVGDVNGMRLITYNKEESLKNYSVLWSVRKKNDLESHLFTDLLLPFGCFRYYTKRGGNRLKYIKTQMAWTQQDIENYLEQNVEAVLMKPNDPTLYRKWLEYMYYNKSFSTAYTQLSRRMIMLRLSFFSSGRCMFSLNTDEPVTIGEFAKELFKISAESRSLEEITTILANGDPNIEAYFEMLHDSRLIPTASWPLPTTVFKIPEAYKYMHLENDLSTVIQYSYSYSNFLLDGRRHKGELSLARDKQKLLEVYPVMNPDSISLIQLNRLLKSQKSRYVVGICYSSKARLSPGEMLRSYLENGLNYSIQYKLQTLREFKVRNPLTNQAVYARDFLYTQSRSILIIEQAVLLYHLVARKMGLGAQGYRDAIEHVVDRESGQPVVEILRNLKLNYMSQSDMHHKKMVAFLKYLLLQDQDDISSLVEHTFGVKHRYLDSFQLKRVSEVYGEVTDAVAFSFRNTSFLAIKQRGKIFCFCQLATYSQQIIATLMSKKLLGLISQNKFESQLTTRTDLQDLISENWPESISFKAKRLSLSKPGGNWIESSSGSGLDCFTGCPPVIFKYTGFMPMPVELDVDVDTGDVHNGRIKLFSLPFWPCGSSQVLYYKDKQISQDFNLKYLNNDKILYSFLHNKEHSVALDNETVGHVSEMFEKNVNFTKFGIEENIKIKENISRESTRFMPDELMALNPIAHVQLSDLIFTDAISLGEPSLLEPDDMRDVLEPDFGDYMLFDDIQSEPDIDLSEEESPISSPLHISGIIQLVPKMFSTGKLDDMLAELPDFKVYLMRCYTSYEIFMASKTPLGCFKIIQLAWRSLKSGVKLSNIELALLLYSLEEVEIALSTNSIDNIRFRVGAYSCHFSNYKLNVESIREFSERFAAERAAKEVFPIVETEDGFEVVIPVSNEIRSKIWKSEILHFPGRHKIWRIFSDLSIELNSF
jgi:hypothetical protein